MEPRTTTRAQTNRSWRALGRVGCGFESCRALRRHHHDRVVGEAEPVQLSKQVAEQRVTEGRGGEVVLLPVLLRLVVGGRAIVRTRHRAVGALAGPGTRW